MRYTREGDAKVLDLLQICVILALWSVLLGQVDCLVITVGLTDMV